MKLSKLTGQIRYQVDRITDPTGLTAKVVGMRDWWARSERARTADRRRGGATVLRLLFMRLGLKEAARVLGLPAP
jgi:hypothetical protein